MKGNKNKGFCTLLIFLLLVISEISKGQAIKSYKVSSPDKFTALEVRTDSGAKLQYRILYANLPVTTWSVMGFIANDLIAGEQTTIISKTQKSINQKFAWPLGEDDTISNNYNEMKIVCKSSSLQFNLIARVFDGSVAFRYEIPQQKDYENSCIKKENTEFRFTEPFTLYQYNQESFFTPVAIDTFKKTCDLPATITTSKLFITIGEAANLNYTKPELKKGANPYSLTTAFVRDSAVKFAGDYQTPWRTISVSKTAIGLHKFSQIS